MSLCVELELGSNWVTRVEVFFVKYTVSKGLLNRLIPSFVSFHVLPNLSMSLLLEREVVILKKLFWQMGMEFRVQIGLEITFEPGIVDP